MKPEPYPFWCRHCKVRHAGECSTVQTGLHEWKDLPIVDLSIKSICMKCGLRYSKSYTMVILKADLPRPVGGCPQKQPF